MASKLAGPTVANITSANIADYFSGIFRLTNYSRNPDVPVFKVDFDSPLPVAASMIGLNQNGPPAFPKKLFVMEVNVKRNDREVTDELKRLLPAPCINETDPQSGTTIGWKTPSHMLVITSVTATGEPSAEAFSIFLLVPASVTGSNDAEYRDDMRLFENQIPAGCRSGP